MTQPTVSKHWRRVVSHPDRPQSNQAHLTVLQYYNNRCTGPNIGTHMLMQVWILNNSGKLVAHDNLFLSIKTDGRNFVNSCSKMFYTVQHLFLWLAVILVHLLQFSWMNTAAAGMAIKGRTPLHGWFSSSGPRPACISQPTLTFVPGRISFQLAVLVYRCLHQALHLATWRQIYSMSLTRYTILACYYQRPCLPSSCSIYLKRSAGISTGIYIMKQYSYRHSILRLYYQYFKFQNGQTTEIRYEL